MTAESCAAGGDTPRQGGWCRGCPVLGSMSPLPKQEAGARPCTEEPVGAETAALEGAASTSPAVTAHLLPCPLGLAPPGSICRCFSPPWRNQPTRSYCCRQEHPCQASSPVGTLLSRALHNSWSPTGEQDTSPMGVPMSPRPCEHPALHRHKPVVGPVPQTGLR